MDKSTIVCSCEEINIDEIETAIKNGAESFDDIKRLTRCGMGPCQSKICFYPVSKIIAEYTGKPLNKIGMSRLRMPLKMVRMSVLAEDSEESSVVSVFGESVEDGES